MTGPFTRRSAAASKSKRAAAAAAAGLALLAFSLGDAGRMRGLHATLSWPLLLALLLLWGAALRGALRESGVALRRLPAAHRAGIAAAGLLTAAAVSLIGDHFKVLSDRGGDRGDRPLPRRNAHGSGLRRSVPR